MRNLTTILLLSTLVFTGVAQELRVYEGEIETAFTLNNNTYLIKTGGKKVNELKNGVYHNEDYHIVYRDTVIIDTIDFKIRDTFYNLHSDSIYFLDSDYKILVFDPKQERFEYTRVEMPTRNILGLCNNEILVYEEKLNLRKQVYFLNTEVIFSTINPYTGAKKSIYSFNNLFEEYDMIVKTEYYPYSKKVRLFTGKDPGQGAGYLMPYKVFTVDLKNKLSTQSNFIIEMEDENLHVFKPYTIFDFSFFDIKYKYKFWNFYKDYYDDNKDHDIEYLIIDSSFKKMEPHFLPKRNDIKGVVYKNDKLDAYWLYSSLDTKIASWSSKYKKAVITYAPDIRIEAALYDVYNNNNTLLDKDTLKSMSHEHLLLLKNMVFAKHNYAFDNSYYQAFFNLFGFYNTEEMRKTRTKEVNDKLTDTDKTNLALVEKALKKYN